MPDSGISATSALVLFGKKKKEKKITLTLYWSFFARMLSLDVMANPRCSEAARAQGVSIKRKKNKGLSAFTFFFSPTEKK